VIKKEIQKSKTPYEQGGLKKLTGWEPPSATKYKIKRRGKEARYSYLGIQEDELLRREKESKREPNPAASTGG